VPAPQGRVVSFKNAIIIMTSNLGSAEIFNHAYKAQQHKASSQETGARRTQGQALLPARVH
jgi:ATP-dependent Clp protease ATP-binding subunit ClpA